MKLINERRTPMHVLILVVMEEGQRLVAADLNVVSLSRS